MELARGSFSHKPGRDATRYFERELGTTVLGGLAGAALFGIALYGSLLGRIVGGLAIAFVLAVIVEPAWKLIRHKPILVITNHGISHREFGLIPWSAIDHVWIRTGLDDRPETPIRVELIDTTPASGRAASLDIPIHNLPVSHEVVLDAMRKHNPRLITFNY